MQFLDNFSTGTRGAVAVEEFARRGYAVVHLRRTGSMCPHKRVLGRELVRVLVRELVRVLTFGF